MEAFAHPKFSSLHKELILGKFWKYVSESNKNYYAKILGEQPEHAKAADVKREFPTEWKSYKKFCIVRNPWDRMVSEYFWRRNKLNENGFDEFISSYSTPNEPNGQNRNVYGWNIYTIDNVPVVDQIIRYENILEELPNALATMGIEWDGWLPLAKSTSRPRDRRDFRGFYSDHSAEAVRRLNRREIDYFGYEFS